MFDAVRNNKRIVQVFLALITLPFALWGVDSYVRNAGAGVDLAKVGDVKITHAEFQEAQRNQQDALRRNLGDRFDPAMLDNPAARRALLEQLVNQRLLLVEARQRKVTISDEVLRDFIAGIPALQENGKFSFAKYEALLRDQGLTQVGFEQQLRQDLMLRQLSAAVGEAVLVSKTTNDAIQAAMAEKRSIQEYRLAPEAFFAQIALDEESLKKEYERDQKAFEEPEQVRAEYVVLSLEAIKSGIKLGDAEARAWYEGRKDRYQQGEERRASHILIAADKGDAAARASAKAKAEALLAQLRAAPAEFGKLAKQNSQDPGSAANDGDLGFFARGAMVKAFDDAVFGLKDKEISGLVETDFGYHIIQLTGIRAAKSRSYDEVRAEVEAEFREQAAQKQYAEAAEAFSNMVYEQADSLAAVVERFKLPVQQSGWMIKGVPALSGSPLAHPKLGKALFSDEVVKNKRNTEAVEIAANTLVAARILEHKPTRVKAFAEVKELIRDRLLKQQATVLATKAGEAKLGELRAGKDAGAVWSSMQTVDRAAPGNLTAETAKVVFSAPVKSLPSYVGLAPRAGGYVIFKISAVDRAGKLPKEIAAALGDELHGVLGREEMLAYLSGLRLKHKVEVNAVALEAK